MPETLLLPNSDIKIGDSNNETSRMFKFLLLAPQSIEAFHLTIESARETRYAIGRERILYTEDLVSELLVDGNTIWIDGLTRIIQGGFGFALIPATFQAAIGSHVLTLLPTPVGQLYSVDQIIYTPPVGGVVSTVVDGLVLVESFIRIQALYILLDEEIRGPVRIFNENSYQMKVLYRETANLSTIQRK